MMPLCCFSHPLCCAFLPRMLPFVSDSHPTCSVVQKDDDLTTTRTFRFSHLTFQEFLSAKQVTKEGWCGFVEREGRTGAWIGDGRMSGRGRAKQEHK